MKEYIKPELKYLSMQHESLLAGESIEVIPEDDEAEEAANQFGLSFDEDSAPAKSVWE